MPPDEITITLNATLLLYNTKLWKCTKVQQWSVDIWTFWPIVILLNSPYILYGNPTYPDSYPGLSVCSTHNTLISHLTLNYCIVQYTIGTIPQHRYLYVTCHTKIGIAFSLTSLVSIWDLYLLQMCIIS